MYRSLGVLLYTLVYGAMPFDGSNFKRLVKQITTGDYYEPKQPSCKSSTSLFQLFPIFLQPEVEHLYGRNSVPFLIDNLSKYFFGTTSLKKLYEDHINITYVFQELYLTPFIEAYIFKLTYIKFECESKY